MDDRQRTPAKPARKHPLVGRGFHEHGEIVKQGAIIAVFPSRNSNVGDLALLQYYGGCSTQRLIPVANLAMPEDAQWTLYESVEEMRDHHERLKDLAEKRAALIEDLAEKRAALWGVSQVGTDHSRNAEPIEPAG